MNKKQVISEALRDTFIVLFGVALGVFIRGDYGNQEAADCPCQCLACTCEAENSKSTEADRDEVLRPPPLWLPPASHEESREDIHIPGGAYNIPGTPTPQQLQEIDGEVIP